MSAKAADLKVVRFEPLEEIDRRLAVVGEDRAGLKALAAIAYISRPRRFSGPDVGQQKNDEARFQEASYERVRLWVSDRARLYGYLPSEPCEVKDKGPCRGPTVALECSLDVVRALLEADYPNALPETKRRTEKIIEVMRAKVNTLLHPSESLRETLDRIQNSPPGRVDFPAATLRYFEHVLRMYAGLCPCCRKKVVLAQDRSTILPRPGHPAARIVDADHTHGRQNVGWHQGWLIHYECNAAIEMAERAKDYDLVQRLRAGHPEWVRLMSGVVPRQGKLF